jgi:hypothetical protein
MTRALPAAGGLLKDATPPRQVVFNRESQSYEEVPALFARPAGAGASRLGQRALAPPSSQPSTLGASGQTLGASGQAPELSSKDQPDASDSTGVAVDPPVEAGESKAAPSISEVLDEWENPVLGCATGHRILELGAWGSASRRDAGAVSRDALQEATLVGQVCPPQGSVCE